MIFDIVNQQEVKEELAATEIEKPAGAEGVQQVSKFELCKEDGDIALDCITRTLRYRILRIDHVDGIISIFHLPEE